SPEVATVEDAKVALVKFLLSLTDPRVKYERAPFDHPEIFVPVDGFAPDNVGGRDFLLNDARFRHVAASGAGGIVTPLTNFLGVSSTPDPAGPDHFDAVTDFASPNEAPVAANDSYTTSATVTLVDAAPGVRRNDFDPNANPFTAILVAGPASGVLTLNANGSFSYVPAGAGVFTFTYQISDGALLSNVATVTITVTP
ncbi:MAG TPA: Ig-like domain-containing protein, partial [Syntrophales bacterium]|nr:Ig-like domain-containing protein [Syntrophales bacterium]